MSRSSRKKKKGIFCTVYFVRREFFKHLCLSSMYSILDTLSEYTYFYISKKHYFIHFRCLFLKASNTFVAYFKNVESLQCILSMREITMPLSDQNYKSQLNLILLFFQVLPLFVLIVLKLNKRNGERFNNGDYQLSETDP